MTIRFVLAALRRRLVTVLLTALVVTGVGVAVGVLWPKTYTAQATILLGIDIRGSDIDPQTASLYLKDRVATYAELVNADEVITPVAEDNGVSPALLRKRSVVTVVPETVVLELRVSAETSEQAVELTEAVSSRYRSQISSFNVQTGGPRILPAEVSSPQPATEPDQLHGTMLFGVSALAGLVAGVLLALLLAAIEAGRAASRSAAAASPTNGVAAVRPPSNETAGAEPANGRVRDRRGAPVKVPDWN